MMDVRSLLNRLEAWAQEEIQARGRMLHWLEGQERALQAVDPKALEEATRGVEREIQCDVDRGTRRDALLGQIAAHWNVPVSAMTLGSIAERAGPGAGRLLKLRAELRDKTAHVVRQNRRVAALTRLHHRLVQDVVQVLFQEEAEAAPLAQPGTLVDAEA